MKVRRTSTAVIVFAGALLLTFPFRAAETLPARLTDDAFWKMVTEFSEAGGYFRFENFLSNELGFQFVIPELKETTRPGGVYVGVGPEQNFTYIAALQPKIAFIADIRRQNMLEQLMYKAFFELSPNRADFVSRLFARPTPERLNADSSPEELFASFDKIKPDPILLRKNTDELKDLLVKQHKFALSYQDVSNIEYVYQVFMEAGPALDYQVGGGGFGGGGSPTYMDLMTMTDADGKNRSYLASEENYKIVRDMPLSVRSMSTATTTIRVAGPDPRTRAHLFE